MTEPELELTGR